jgi:hypothetical protein
MNAARLIKYSPTAILVIFLGYAAYSLQAALPDAAEKQAAIEKGFDLLLKKLVTTDPAGGAASIRSRDPFLVVRPPAPPEAAEPDAPESPESDPLAEVIADLKLDATFLQGRDQLAIINGRIYHKGQALALAGQDKSLPSIVVLFVKPTGVILRGGGKNYLLGYPEHLGKKPDDGPGDAREAGAETIDPAGQAAMFKKLLNSPLGALGKSLIGDAVPSRPPSGSRRGARDRRNGTRSSGPSSP